MSEIIAKFRWLDEGEEEAGLYLHFYSDVTAHLWRMDKNKVPHPLKYYQIKDDCDRKCSGAKNKCICVFWQSQGAPVAPTGFEEYK